MMLTILRAAVLLVALGCVARAEEPKKEAPAKVPTFKAPKDWKAVELRKTDIVIVAARFESGEGDKTVAVSVIGSGGDGGGLVPNVNRWRAQVGLEALDEKAALKSVTAIKVGGLDGHQLDATGPANADKPAQRVVVVLVKSGDTTWFIKMNGPAAPVGEQKAAFDEFVKSIRFEK